jgi:ribonuclease BN (tRNA processing enzyme)
VPYSSGSLVIQAVKIQLLPSSIGGDGLPSLEQHLTCFLIDNLVTIDGGSVALSLTGDQHNEVRDVVITHVHMDHIATLPIFIDDEFSALDEPIRIHATEEVIETLERDIFNWNIYPRFSELNNGKSRVLEYVPFRTNEEFKVGHLRVKAIAVNHIVPTVGLIVTDGSVTVAFSSDTAATEDFWRVANSIDRIDALFIEASFPNSMAELATSSKHLTPQTMKAELGKMRHTDMDILVVHIKPAFRDVVIRELMSLGISSLAVMEPGKNYEW